MAEGGGLLNRYTDFLRIEGSNPSLSAMFPAHFVRALCAFFCTRVSAFCALSALLFSAGDSIFIGIELFTRQDIEGVDKKSLRIIFCHSMETHWPAVDKRCGRGLLVF